MRPFLLFALLVVLGSSSAYASNGDDDSYYRPPWRESPICAVYSWSVLPVYFDTPIAQGMEERTWFFGPRLAEQFEEPYEEDGYTLREVQYWEKGRQACTPAMVPSEDDPSMLLPAMTLGLLATELMTGQIQVSHTQFKDREPSEVHVAGDPGTGVGPTYRTMGQVMDESARDVGAVITETIHRDGTIETDDWFADHGVTAAYYISETDHTVADVFWEFMTGTFTAYLYPAHLFEERELYPDSIELIGFPRTEAYWTTVPVAGEDKDVLVQCFERRCLTYTPDNPENWQVEMGNIGLHYYQWRYPDGHE